MVFDEWMNEFVVEREVDMSINIIYVVFILCVCVLGYSGGIKEIEVCFLLGGNEI